MRSVLITGASCFIGKPLMKKLLEQGYKVYAVVRQPEKITFSHQELHIIKCDMKDYAKLTALIDDKIDIFYHLAWNGTRGSDRLNEEMQRENTVYSLNAVKIAHELGAKAFVGIGSQAEYGNCEGIVTEDYPAAPTTAYGEEKLEVCIRGRQMADKLGMKFLWPRIFSAYGVGDYEGTLVISSLRKMLRNEPVQLSVCTQIWDFLNIHDVVSALISLPQAESGVYNFASGEYRVLKEYVEEMKKLAGSSSELMYGTNPNAMVVSFMPNSNKLKRAINWKPKVSFEAGINEIINSMRN